MKKIKRTFFIKETGLTLVEVLASIVILSIILTIFLSIFIQTAKTNKTSEEIVDATYIAQTEMEKFYGFSRTYDKDVRDSEIVNLEEGYTFSMEEGKEIYRKNDEGYLIKITLNEDEEINLTNILVQVYDDSEDARASAQMQNLVKWKDGADD